MFIRVVLIGLCLVCANAHTLSQTTPAADFSGAWVLQQSEDRNGKRSRASGTATLVISQSGPEIKITRKFIQAGTETVQELTYYTDERGENNPTSDGKHALKSVSRRKGNKLIVTYVLFASNPNTIVNERIDEWKLSSDGKTLTQTSSFTSSSPASDASNNPYGRPQAPNVLAQPLRWKEKKVFKRI